MTSTHCSIFRYDNGKTFVVKDTERFATEIIPDYFKHNNFSSFVRQLNFYGFRKIKADPLRLRDAASSEESKYWKFRHDKFQKGRPDLLCEIKKNTAETADKHEVDHLKTEIRELREKLDSANDDINELKSFLLQLKKNDDLNKVGVFVPEVGSKKRRVEGSKPVPVMSESLGPFHGELQPLLVMSELEPEVTKEFSTSNASVLSLDDEIVAMLANLDAYEEEVLDESPLELSASVPSTVVSAPQAPVDPVLVDKFRGALANLPVPMQTLFVDRIVAAIGNPEEVQKQVDAMTDLATIVAQEAQRRLLSTGHVASDEHTISLATAILGAYLSCLTSGPSTPLSPVKTSSG